MSTLKTHDLQIIQARLAITPTKDREKIIAEIAAQKPVYVENHNQCAFNNPSDGVYRIHAIQASRQGIRFIVTPKCISFHKGNCSQPGRKKCSVNPTFPDFPLITARISSHY